MILRYILLRFTEVTLLNRALVVHSVGQLNNVFGLDFPPSLPAHHFLPLLFLGITSQVIIYCIKALISGMPYGGRGGGGKQAKKVRLDLFLLAH